jgi:hypothetical protein
VIPYTYFGHTDPKSWIGFDMVVLATDSFFMAMFFFLSGLFVWPGLGHKASIIFYTDTRTEHPWYRLDPAVPKFREDAADVKLGSTVKEYFFQFLPD